MDIKTLAEKYCEETLMLPFDHQESYAFHLDQLQLLVNHVTKDNKNDS